MRWLYSILLYILTPLIVLRLWLRGRKAPAYRTRIAERFGFFNAAVHAGGIWVHAVSVGESIAAAPMIRALLARYPQQTITVTTMTPTGSERVRVLFADEIANGRVFHVYAPYDIPSAIRRFLQRIKPRLLIVVETELWPNTIHASAARGIPVLIANARLSEKSARGYDWLGAITQPMLHDIAIVAAQNAQDGERFVALGLPRERLQITGSVKFDLTIDATLQARAQQLREILLTKSMGARPVWIAASTHAGEDEILLAAQRDLLQRNPDALLMLVPRHPERFNEVAALIAASGLSMQRRSAGTCVHADTQVLLGDTMGELLLLFGAADVAFVGGSLVERGGHNTLEPAAWGLPIITGASDFNFREISELLMQAGALVKCASGADIAREVQRLFADAAARKTRGQAARRVVERNRGALDKLLAAIASLLG